MNDTHSKVSAEEIQAELTKENIAPVKIESEDDAVKAADAEVVEALTVGAAEQAGAEAGEEAGAKAAQLTAQQAVAEAVKKAVAETAQQVHRSCFSSNTQDFALQQCSRLLLFLLYKLLFWQDSALKCN